MAEQYLFNNIGLSLYGIIVRLDGSGRESIDSLLSWPERKPSLTNDRQDQNGIEIDLDDPKFAAREFVLKCALHAEDRDDFKRKYNGFRTALFSQDTHNLFSVEDNETYKVFYKKQNSFRTYNPINKLTDVWATFDVVLGETNPTENLQDVYLVDDQDRFLIM